MTEPQRPTVDHLLLGARDLDAGIAWLEARTGVRAERGGSHPGARTHNALASLGAGRYLEILALDPAQAGARLSRLGRLVESLAEPRLVAWCARVPDLDAAARHAAAAGLDLEGPLPGSRRRADGALLSWRTLWPRDTCEGVVPFLIEWSAETEHPSRTAPAGLELEALALEHPETARVRRWLDGLEIEVALHEGPLPALRALIRSRREVVEVV